MSEPLNVLLVEDSENDAILVMRALRQDGFAPVWERVQTAEEMRAALSKCTWDVVISDYRLPKFSAPAALEVVKQSGVDLPFIVVSGTIGEQSAVEMMKAGAHDYVMKDNLNRLPEAVRREIRDARVRVERQQTETALKQSEATNRAIVQAIPDLLLRMDRHGNYTHLLTRGTVRAINLMDDIQSTCIYDTFPHDLAIQKMHYVQQALATGELQVFEQQLDIDGELYFEEVRITALGEDEVLIIVRDITDRKQAEEALRESEAQSRAILAALPDLMFRLHRDGTHLGHVALRKSLDVVPDDVEAMGQPVTNLVPPELANRLMYYLKQALITGTVQLYEQEVQGRDHVQYEEVRVVKSGENEALFMVRDISDRKLAEAALQNLIGGTASVTGEDFFPALVRHIATSFNVSYVIVTEFNDHHIRCLAFWAEGHLEVNEIWNLNQVLLCHQVFEQGTYCIQRSIMEHYPDHEILQQLKAESYLGIALKNAEGNVIGTLCILDTKPLMTPDRTTAILQVFAARAAAELERQQAMDALQTLNQELEGIVEQRTVQLRQINEQLAFSNIELARATRLKDEFLANMSHELRTPLNAILGLSEGMQDQIFGVLNERQQKAIASIERSGQHLLELINDILDLSKIASGKLELHTGSVVIKNLCESSLVFVRQQALQKHIRLSSQIPDYLGHLIADERRMRQVLINLLSNAVKFTPEGGNVSLEVTVSTPEDHLNQVNLPPALLDHPCPLVLFHVIDNGIGIAPDDINRLFQPFMQVDSRLNRQYSGTGLGLSLVKQITELHGGGVSVTSSLGNGSRFTVALPCQTPYQITPAVKSVLEEPDQCDKITHPLSAPSTPLILLAEDNEANISTLTAYLGAHGYRLVLARDGNEAVTLAKTQTPDLILMDIQMPGMDGLEATRQIRAEQQLTKTPIIALTALAMPGDQERCMAAGVNEYLAKPLKLRHLVNLIQQFLK